MDKLHVVSVISNPCRYKARYELYKKFEAYVAKSDDCVLHTVEASFGERPHEISAADHPAYVQVNTSSEIWHKENLLNIGISRLPSDWKYVAWIDADVTFARPDWALEAVHQLQHFPVVQMFSQVMDLGPDHTSISTRPGFGFGYVHGLPLHPSGQYAKSWHPGFAWAARREFINAVGGLFDTAILGAGDYHMATAMIGHVERSMPNGLTQQYKDSLLSWQTRAEKYGQHNLGYVDGLLLHYFHGIKAHRKYQDRWHVLVDEQYNPQTDIKKDSQGVWQLVVENERQERLRDKIRLYFRERQEDRNCL
jgi:hypothetical protein